MPTKPGAITVRASQLNYSTGPLALIGSATKITTAGAQTTEGYKVDSPLGTFPVPAQAINFFNNQTDVWIANWVFLGTSAADEDAHIVETDSDGETNLASLVAGGTTSDAESVTITPNSGSGATGLFVQGSATKPGAIFETTDEDVVAALFRAPGVDSDLTDPGILRVEVEAGGPTGIRVEGAGVQGDPVVAPLVHVINDSHTGACFRADAGPGENTDELDGGPGFWGVGGADSGAQSGGLAALFEGITVFGDVVQIDSAAANGVGRALAVTHSGNGYAIEASKDNGRKPTMKLTSFDTGGGESAAPLVLTPQDFDPAGQGRESGSIWIRMDTLGFAEDQYHPRFDADLDQRWFWWTDNATCAMDAFVFEIIAGNNDDNFFICITSDFPDKMIPVAIGRILITFKCQAFRGTNTSDIDSKDGVLIKIIDLTETEDILIATFDFAPKNTGNIENTIQTTVDMTTIYTLPAAGERTFQVLAQRKVGSASGTVHIENPYLRIRPVPAEDIPS